MTLKIDPKFEEKLTCGFEYHIFQICTRALESVKITSILD